MLFYIIRDRNVRIKKYSRYINTFSPTLVFSILNKVAVFIIIIFCQIIDTLFFCYSKNMILKRVYCI